MITQLSSDLIDEHTISEIFIEVLETTLLAYQKMGDYELEPMGSRQDMMNNLHKISGSILRACKTYYNSPEEQLVQIISSITVNHYLENGNKRTAVSAGLLYLIYYKAIHTETEDDKVKWIYKNIRNLKVIADAFAQAGSNFDNVKEQMTEYARCEIFA